MKHTQKKILWKDFAGPSGESAESLSFDSFHGYKNKGSFKLVP